MIAAIESSYLSEALLQLEKGGSLMIVIFFVALFIYYTAIDLYLRLRQHFLIRGRVHKLSIASIRDRVSDRHDELAAVACSDSSDLDEVRRHYQEVRQEYLPVIDRRIRFLAIIITVGPLLGLLGTVSGMLKTFQGMLVESGTKFENMIVGISEALLTTQTGLIVSIPALIILSFIIQRRGQLERSIARIEHYTVNQVEGARG